MIFKQLAMAAILFFKMRPKLCRDRFLYEIESDVKVYVKT